MLVVKTLFSGSKFVVFYTTAIIDSAYFIIVYGSKILGHISFRL